MSGPDFEGVLAGHYTYRPAGNVGAGWACICGEHLSQWWPVAGCRPRETALDVALRTHLSAALHSELARWLGDEGTREVLADALRHVGSPTRDSLATAALAALTTTDQEDR